MLGSQCTGFTPSTRSDFSTSSVEQNPLLQSTRVLNTPKFSKASHGQSQHFSPQQAAEKTTPEGFQEKKSNASQVGIDTYLSLLRDCCNTKALREGKSLHKRILDNGYGQNRLLGNTLIHMYGKCGALSHAHDVFCHLIEKNVFTWTMMLGASLDCGSFMDAHIVFDKMPERSIVAWNIMIAACVQHGWRKEALQFYQEMQPELTPDKFTFLHILPICNHKEGLTQGKAFHGHIVKFGLECDTTIGNALLNMYGKCSDLENAERMFEKILERDLFSWNTMISVYAQHRQGKKAIELFPQMQLKGIVPDYITYVGLLDACAVHLDSAEGEDMHKCAVGDGFESNIVVGTALVNMYGKCKSLDAAERSFSKMSERDLIAWNAMIEAYAQHGKYTDALELLQQMKLEGFIPDMVTFISLLSSCTSQESLHVGRQIHKRIQIMGLELDVALGNALVNMYGKCGSLDEAWMMFSQMLERNVVSWNAMITACTQYGQGKMALDLFQEMQREGVVPDEVTMLGVLEACASQAVLYEGKQVHGYIEHFGLVLDAVMGSALIKMYSKCGSLEDAQRVFDETPKKDVILWNTMIGSYAQHGFGKKALQIFQRMKTVAVKPNEGTFASVLSACSHAGLSAEGWHYFLSMSQDYGITPTMEHYNILIDLLGRSGQIADVQDLIKSMPLQPTATSWLTLLSACKKHSDMEVGKRIAERVLELDPKTSGPYVLCSNIGQSGNCGRD